MRPGAGGPRQQRYQDMVRRATSAPRTGPPEEAGEPISGPHAVIEALRAGRQIKRLYVAQERGIRSGPVNDLIREAQERRLQILFVDRLDVERLSPGVEHQGVVAIAEGRQGVELDELLLHLDTLTEPPLIVVIDSLQDPQNFGVLLRSAEGAGADGVIIPRHRQVGLTPAVSRTSAGASEHLLIADVANLRQALDALREKGIWVVGSDDSGDVEWDEVDYRGATAIVIGGEGEGIRRLVLEGCDQVVRIPMQGKVASLNAAAAGTVLLFEALRQRMRDAAPPQIERPPRVEEAERSDEGEEPPASDLLLDEDAPVGDEVRGDDRDVEEFAEAEEPMPVQEDKPKKRTAAKRTTRKKAE
jgi:23S rRNA (guanosine2251-2'-O)-methyltransferase